jgi:DNA invertase Pin-like site-specific DNA recombinase
LWNHYSISDNLNKESIKVIEYKESGVKLSEEDRLGITDLKKLAEVEEIDTIYVSELSRIARSEKVLWSFIEYLQSHKIQLKCLNPSFTLLNESRTEIEFASRIMVSTFGSLSTQEAIEKKRRFARGKARKAREGKYNGGAIPYGYKIGEDNLIVIDEEGEGKIVREIFNLYEGGMSQKQIAKEMFERGIPSRAVRNTNRFTISLVHQILTNKLLTGQPNLNKGSSYERTYPMIITRAAPSSVSFHILISFTEI